MADDPVPTTAVTDRERWLADLRHREHELELRKKEVSLRERELAAMQWRNPLVLAIIAASVAALGNAWVAYYNGHAQRELEREKAEEARILEVLKASRTDVLANLGFLASVHLVTDPDVLASLQAYLKNPPKDTPHITSGDTPATAEAKIVELQVKADDARGSLAHTFCEINDRSKWVAYCQEDSLAACNAAHDKLTPGPFKSDFHCTARPASVHCFAYHSVDRLNGNGPPMLLTTCYVDRDSCEASRSNYRTIPGIQDLGAQCEEVTSPP